MTIQATTHRDELLSRLDASDDPKAAGLARRLLSSAEIEPLSKKPSLIKASAALSIWETRQDVTAITKAKILGAPSLIKRLRSLDPDSTLEQFAFLGPKSAGNVFFERQGGSLVGVVFVDRDEGARQPASK